MQIGEHLNIKRLNGHKTQSGDSTYYRIFWISKAPGEITINETPFAAYTNHIFFIIPQVKANIKASDQTSGWIIEFDKNYFDLLEYEPLLIKNANLYYSLNRIPQIVLSPKIGLRVKNIFEMIDEMAGSEIPNKENGMFSLLRTILTYCDSKCNINLTEQQTSQDLATVIAYKEMVAQHYTRWHKVSDYAGALNITSKHLNYLVKNTLGMTAKTLIKEQLIMHARRDLKFTNKNIKEIAFSLGFPEPFHFSSFFKSFIGCSPTQYRLQ